MADIELTLGGDASGATAALNQTGEATGNLASQTGKAVVAWQLMAEVATKAASAVVKYGTDAVKAFAAAERIQAQLNRAAGEYGETLGKQAEALSRVYAIDDDIIKQSQTLLAQWGGVGAATRETTEAILNYATATGTDAVGATQALIRNVESGGAGMAKLGIHFRETGKKGDDLAAAVGAINAKFHGAALTDANTLSGSAHAAQLAVDDLQKSIGGMLGTMLDQSGGMAFITEGIRKMTAGLEVAFAVALKARSVLGGLLRGDVSLATAGDELKNTATEAFMRGGVAAPGALPAASNALTNKGRKDAAAGPSAADRADDSRKAAEVTRDFMKEDEEFKDTQLQKEQERYADELALEARRVADSIKIREDGKKAYDEIRVSEEKAAAAHAEKLIKIEQKKEDDALKDSNDRTAKKARDAAATADAIGSAFVNALADQLSKLAAGEEFDVALFVGDILASVIAVAGSVIGAAYGQPALGAAIGNLAAMGVRAGAGALSADAKKGRMKKHHSGAWIGDDLGQDEEVFIGQRDERVLSRKEVATMGGRQAVDAAAKGGGGARMAVSIMAIDAKNAAESFMTDLSRGMKRALRTGQGDLPLLLGVMPR